MAAVVTTVLFATPVAAYDGSVDTGPEKIEQVECSSWVDAKCQATSLDIQIRNNLLEHIESYRGMADDWDERSQDWQQSDFESIQNIGEYFSDEADSTHKGLDQKEEQIRNNSIPELMF